MREQVENLDHRLNNRELNYVAEKAAEGAINKMWINLGYDLSDAESVQSLNADLAHMRRVRLASEKISGLALKIVATSIIGSIIAALGSYFKDHLKP